MLVTDEGHFKAVLPAVPASVAEARHAVARFAESQGADPEQIAIAVSEAVSNVVRHAYCGREAPVAVEAVSEDRDVVVTVKDRGIGMRPTQDHEGPGYGLPLISNLADHVVVDSLGWGLTVQMRFKRH